MWLFSLIGVLILVGLYLVNQKASKEPSKNAKSKHKIASSLIGWILLAILLILILVFAEDGMNALFQLAN